MGCFPNQNVWVSDGLSEVWQYCINFCDVTEERQIFML